jgi:hypothetical protein
MARYFVKWVHRCSHLNLNAIAEGVATAGEAEGGTSIMLSALLPGRKRACGVQITMRGRKPIVNNGGATSAAVAVPG